MVLLGREITVLGAGIGGLTAALCLAARGARVTVLEQAPEIREMGAGLQISPNGRCVLQALGLGETLDAATIRARAVVLRDFADGREVLRMPLEANDGFRLTHRADLIDLLADAARAAGITLRLGCKVDAVELEDGAHPVLRLADGTSETAEILVGADGLHSQVRKVVERPVAPFFTGQVAWRMVLPQSVPPEPEASVFMGPGRHVVSYPLREGRERNVVAVEERDRWTTEGWTHKDDPMRVARAFASFAPQVRNWLKAAQTVHVWGLFRHEVAARWHKDGAVLVGDAAHPTLPFLAQGANMALEDAWVLADSLAQADSREAGFALYQSRREARVRRTVQAANGNARNYHLQLGPVRSMAHTGLSLFNRFAPTVPLRKFDWLYGKDVTRG
ncbi:FAD-dependent monooxygenase [Dinoroseobacter sp. PD6]|uniref:FAD-dependent monooxygenase n=1 Tax=Dinoroseobacter sp. PD6 TaxID=3028384 RepID=UPI00237C19B3|nr:FAD-dependent monooxygenase [Dinoroseobacter sp. PD6]MDD9715274.1 FAD-dependent monooxygenase [Dinoroseobacter sp. PD6]